jgi:hypothetical protein
MTRQELVQKAKEMGVAKPQNMKTSVLEELINTQPQQTTDTPKRGRKVNPSSSRQKRLAELEVRKQNGLLKRGRPINSSSQRQVRLKDIEARKANGTFRRGRPSKSNVVSFNVEQ